MLLKGFFRDLPEPLLPKEVQAIHSKLTIPNYKDKLILEIKNYIYSVTVKMGLQYLAENVLSYGFQLRYVMSNEIGTSVLLESLCFDSFSTYVGISVIKTRTSNGSDDITHS